MFAFVWLFILFLLGAIFIVVVGISATLIIGYALIKILKIIIFGDTHEN